MKLVSGPVWASDGSLNTPLAPCTPRALVAMGRGPHSENERWCGRWACPPHWAVWEVWVLKLACPSVFCVCCFERMRVAPGPSGMSARIGDCILWSRLTAIRALTALIYDVSASKPICWPCWQLSSIYKWTETLTFTLIGVPSLEMHTLSVE